MAPVLPPSFPPCPNRALWPTWEAWFWLDSGVVVLHNYEQKLQEQSLFWIFFCVYTLFVLCAVFWNIFAYSLLDVRLPPPPRDGASIQELQRDFRKKKSHTGSSKEPHVALEPQVADPCSSASMSPLLRKLWFPNSARAHCHWACTCCCAECSQWNLSEFLSSAPVYTQIYFRPKYYFVWTLDRVWIIGDSYVRRGEETAAKTVGRHLGLINASPLSPFPGQVRPSARPSREEKRNVCVSLGGLRWVSVAGAVRGQCGCPATACGETQLRRGRLDSGLDPRHPGLEPRQIGPNDADGLKWKRFRVYGIFFHQCLRGRSAPDVLLIHCGGNDLGEEKSVDLVAAMKEDLHRLHHHLPSMKIIFSGLTQRRRWRNGVNAGKIDKARKFVNSVMSSFMVDLGIFVHHPHIRYDTPGLFLPDDVHL
ncbi:hypothetical protein WMY93_006338 [Mugilogobius chulae]|uniref:SGNH hydrolase-type esterase domain-containing protein n=1 Tax=Mugilogobius chulae TaxID=88201 RepID=A0AAW0PYY8_9GOBI